MNKNPALSLAGLWTFAAGNTDIVTFYSQIQLGANKAHGLVLGGWAYAGWSNSTVYTTNLAVLDENADGTLKLNTNKYISNPTINGAGSVIVTDLNHDGVDDIFLAAHNESPSVSKSSTVYLSSGVDQFNKISLNDATQSHSAILSMFNGVPTIVTSGYGVNDPYYQFTTSTQSIAINQWGNTFSGSIYGSTAITVDLNNDGKSELIIGDFKTGPGYSYVANAPTALAIYTLNGNQLGAAPTIVSYGYFTNNAQYSGVSTHMYRVWTDDFNHDGLADLMLGVGIYSRTSGWQASKLQMMQNNGGFKFTDMSNALGSAYSSQSNNVDYSMQKIDLDQSGINTYLLGEANTTSAVNNCNYLLLNDGTGKLYTALHDEFLTWGANVRSYLDGQGIAFNRTFVAPKFIAYQLADGSINYEAQYISGGNDLIPLVNVPVHYNITTDFTQNITISDRNQSMLMRTWAGNDTFYDTNANTQAAHIDGGLGSNLSVYSDKAQNYSVTGLAGGSYEVKHATANSAPNVDDMLVNIQRLQFTDTNIALDIAPNQTAGSVYMLYQATFNRTPDAAGLGYWINAVDKGANIITNVAASFIQSPEFVAKYGSNPSNASYVDNLYQNVLHRAGESGGVAYWNQQLNTGAATKAFVLEQFATLAEGAALVAPAIVHGIAYTQWVG
jgi:hypothetical protein